MLTFTRQFKDGRTDQVSMTPDALIVAGWTGRDEAALNHHIEELAAIGVPRPSSVPVFYRNAATNIVQTDRLEVLGPDTSGEVEPVIVALDDGLWIGRRLGSHRPQGRDDGHRAVEAAVRQGDGPDAVAFRRDHRALGSDHDPLVRDDRRRRTLYQEGPLAAMRHPDDLIARYGKALAPKTIMFCGTLGAQGGIRPASRFEMELDDPVLKRRMTHAYDVVDLPVIT